MERLFCVIIGGLFGLFIGIILTLITWSGYSIFCGKIASFEFFQQALSVFGLLLSFFGMMAVGVFKVNNY